MEFCEGRFMKQPPHPRSFCPPPSIMHTLWGGRVPLKLMPLDDVSALTPPKGGRLLDTPRPRAANEVMLRPLVASCSTCGPLMRVLTSLLSVCTCKASAVTVTVWAWLPTARTASCSTDWATLITMPVFEYF